jgi:hypothetical protein
MIKDIELSGSKHFSYFLCVCMIFNYEVIQLHVLDMLRLFFMF